MNHLKRIVLLTVCTTILSHLNAQFAVGVKGGLNYSQVTADRFTEQDLTINGLKYTPGYFAGVALQYKMGSFGIESGVYYSVLGGKGSVNKGISKLEVSMNPTYVQVPLLFSVKMGVSKKSYIYPLLGMYFGYGMGGEITQTRIMGEQVIKKTTTDYFTDARQKMDIGTSLSLNFEWNKVVIGAGYDYGLKRVNTKKAAEGEKNKHNSNFKLSIGYLF